MTLPIIEQIAVALLSALQTITTENDYSYPLTVTRLTKRYTPFHLGAVVYQHDPILMPNADTRYVYWQQIFMVEIDIAPDDTNTTPIDTFINCIKADIEDVVKANYNWSNLALDSKTLPEETTRSDDGQQCDLYVPIQVEYRTLYNNAYST